MRRTTFIALSWMALISVSAHAAELQPQTIAAFDRYVRATEFQMESIPFLRVEGLPDSERRPALETMRRGDLYIERRTTREGGKEIDVPGGLIHHWIGSAFVPGATVDEALALLQDYDRHAEIFQPMITRSKLLKREGDVFRVFLRFHTKKVITVVVNGEHEARFQRPAPDRAQSAIRSLRLSEVDNPDTPQEQEKPVGRDGGFLWRLNTYWHVLERDGGTYIQCEAISLTRRVPAGLGWLIGPFITSIPREGLTFTLETARKRLSGNLITQ